MKDLRRAWMPAAYDLVVCCRDHFGQRAGGDRFRDKVLGLQDDEDHAVYQACQESHVPLTELPTGLGTAERVRWTADQVNHRGLLDN